MKSWTENLIQYCKDGSYGICPQCNSKKIKLEEHNSKRKSVTFHCDDCGSWDHFDGVRTTRGIWRQAHQPDFY